MSGRLHARFAESELVLVLRRFLVVNADYKVATQQVGFLVIARN